MPQFLRASCFALSLSREKAQRKRNIKIFYHYQEEFSINFHIFIHKKTRASDFFQRMRLFAKGRQKSNNECLSKKSPGKPSKTGRFLGSIRLKEPPSCSNCTSPFSKEESGFYPVLRSLSLFYLRCILLLPGGSQILADGSAEPSVFSCSNRIFSVFS